MIQQVSLLSSLFNYPSIGFSSTSTDIQSLNICDDFVLNINNENINNSNQTINEDSLNVYMKLPFRTRKHLNPSKRLLHESLHRKQSIEKNKLPLDHVSYDLDAKLFAMEATKAGRSIFGRLVSSRKIRNEDLYIGNILKFYTARNSKHSIKYLNGHKVNVVWYQFLSNKPVDVDSNVNEYTVKCVASTSDPIRFGVSFDPITIMDIIEKFYSDEAITAYKTKEGTYETVLNYQLPGKSQSIHDSGSQITKEFFDCYDGSIYESSQVKFMGVPTLIRRKEERETMRQLVHLRMQLVDSKKSKCKFDYI